MSAQKECGSLPNTWISILGTQFISWTIFESVISSKKLIPDVPKQQVN